MFYCNCSFSSLNQSYRLHTLHMEIRKALGNSPIILYISVTFAHGVATQEEKKRGSKRGGGRRQKDRGAGGSLEECTAALAPPTAADQSTPTTADAQSQRSKKKSFAASLNLRLFHLK